MTRAGRTAWRLFELGGRAGALAVLICCATTRVWAQAPSSCEQPVEIALYDFADVRSNLVRALSITRAWDDEGSGIFQSSVRTARVCADSASFVASWGSQPRGRMGITPVELDAGYNSAYPRDRNNGVVWAGVGLTTALSAGVEGQWKWLSGAIMPTVAYHANEDFRTVASTLKRRSPFSNPYQANVDYPSRFGEQAYSAVDVGRSFVRTSFGAFEARFSNEGLWLGPAQVFPLLLSNTAPGFPHFRVGTARPLSVGFGSLELNAFWGSVSMSDYFDIDPERRSHLFAGANLVLNLRALPGLYLGAARVQHVPDDAFGHGPGVYAEAIISAPTFAQGGNREGNGIGALFARWVLPESDFEVYIEWARDDTPFNTQDLLREPDWTQATVMGFQKTFVGGHGIVRLFGEILNVGESTPVRAGKNFMTFYTHSSTDGAMGHTHKGQLLGAGLGLGANTRLLGVERYTSDGRVGLSLQHARYDDDTYYRRFSRRYGEARHDMEITAEGSVMRRWGDFAADMRLRLSRRYDRDFITLVEDEPPGAETNVGVEIAFRWTPRVFSLAGG